LDFEREDHQAAERDHGANAEQDAAGKADVGKFLEEDAARRHSEHDKERLVCAFGGAFGGMQWSVAQVISGHPMRSVGVQRGTAYPIGDDASVELSKYSCSGAVTARPMRERMKAGVTAAFGSPPVVKKRSPTEITLRNSCDWAPQTAEQKAENRVVHGEVGDGR